MHNENRHYTLPNMISFARICFIPPFVICVMQVQYHDFYRYIALGVLLIIGLSDVLDGYLARKLGETTNLVNTLTLLLISCY
jgi:phosphatidylglycerophosphate synthase